MTLLLWFPPTLLYNPAFWKREASCIRFEESRGEWHLRDGAYQIIPATWAAFKVARLGQSCGPRLTPEADVRGVADLDSQRPELGPKRSAAVECSGLRGALT